MIRWLQDGIFALFLVACLILGGASREGFLGNFLLQVAAILLLSWGLYKLDWRILTRSEKALLTIAALGVVIVLMQFLPLGSDIWRQLPGREKIAEELDMLGSLPESGFVSLSVHESLMSAMWALPALGFALALIANRQIPVIPIAITLVAASLLSLGVGLAQFLGGSESSWYLYDFTNRGFMVGFFSNANHMATLLLVTLPFIAALIRAARDRSPRQRLEIAALGIPLFALILIGVGLVGSLTGYALAGPVALASAMIVWPPTKRLAAALVVPVLLAAGTVIVVAGEQDNMFSSEAGSSVQGRAQIHQDAWPAARDFFPAGTGLGTFEEVHRRYEDRTSISRTFIAHAHNDYLELLIELGAPGAFLIGAFVMWWLLQLPALLRLRNVPFGWAGWIACGVILTHSVWDYPLRTAALSTVFALACVLVASSARTASDGQFRHHRPPSG